MQFLDSSLHVDVKKFLNFVNILIRSEINAHFVF